MFEPLFMIKKFTILFLFLSIGFRSLTQEEFVPPQAKFITQIPFTQISGGLIMLRATLDTSSIVLNFILDTGSGGISLDSSVVAKLALVATPTERVIKGIAGTRKVSFSYGHYLNFENFTTDTFSFHINDYEIISSAYGYKIDGIIGYSFLRRYIVKIDYDTKIIELFTPGTFKYPKGGYLMKPNFTTLPLTNFTIGNENKISGRYIFDTGAGLCFLLNKEFTEDSFIFKKKTKFYATQAEGLGGKKTMQLAVVKQVFVGPYKFKDVPVYIFDDEFNVTSYPNNVGVIGNDILSRFNIVLNYPEQTIYLKPNNKYADDFDYSYTGLSIYSINENIVVTEVIKDSPGDKAGFKPDDIILAVENNFNQNIQSIKFALQNAGTKLNVLISRKGKIEMMILEVKNILK